MLREGATLKAEPCPYCGGVRVMRGGHALCVGCGSEPDGKGERPAGPVGHEGAATAAAAGGSGAGDAGRAVAVLEKRLAEAAAELRSSPRGADAAAAVAAARADLLDEIASLAAAIRSLESGAAGGRPPPLPPARA